MADRTTYATILGVTASAVGGTSIPDDENRLIYSTHYEAGKPQPSNLSRPLL